MKNGKNFIRVLFLGIFVLGTIGSAQARPETQYTSQLNVKKPATTRPGALFTIAGRSGAAVYQVGSDGKKYIFTDQSSFKTWHDDFSEVEEVSQEELDSFEDGGTVPFQAGVRLLTHRMTAKVYAVGKDGALTHVPDEATAKKFYGEKWQELVSDIDAGVFATSYKVKAGTLGEENLPEDTVVQEGDSGDYFIIKNNLKRRITLSALIANRLLIRRQIIKIKKLSNMYAEGAEIDSEEEGIGSFDPGAGTEKVSICFRGKRTLRVSSRALAAHLATGSTEGACVTEKPVILPICDHNGDSVRNLSDVVTLAQCRSTFDVNGDGVHTLEDISLYATNNQDDAWCATNFVCRGAKVEDEVEDADKVEDEVATLDICDHNGDGVRNLSDVSLLAQCQDTFDTNGDGIHNLADVSEYAENNQDDNWCAANFVCNPEEASDPDLTDLIISHITMDPALPKVNETVTITVNVKNNGSVALKSNTGIIQTSVDFEDFLTASPTVVPDISPSNALLPGGITILAYEGSFSFAGTKTLAAYADQLYVLAENNETNNAYEVDVTISEALAICDLNEDGLRNLADVGIFAGCQDTFDVNDDGIHNLSDISEYAGNNQDNNWCATNFVCDANASSTPQ